MQKRTVFRYCGGILMLGSVVYLLFVLVKVFHQQQTIKWTATEATVLAVDYSEYGTRRSERGTARIKIQYQYAAKGNDYTSDQIVLGKNEYKRDAESMSRFAEGNPRSSKLKVFYNPKKPESAVVFPGIDWMATIANLGFGTVGFITGYIFACRGSFGRSLKDGVTGDSG